MVAKKEEEQRELAAIKIQRFVRDINTYKRLKKDCLKCGDILQLRRGEITAASESQEPEKNFLTKFIRYFYGVKMTSRNLEGKTTIKDKRVDAIKAPNESNSPGYMRDTRDPGSKTEKHMKSYLELKSADIHPDPVIKNGLKYKKEALEQQIRLKEKEEPVSSVETIKTLFKTELQKKLQEPKEINQCVPEVRKLLESENIVIPFGWLKKYSQELTKNLPSKAEGYVNDVLINLISSHCIKEERNKKDTTILRAIELLNDQNLFRQYATNKSFLQHAGAIPSYYTIVETLMSQGNGNFSDDPSKILPLQFSNGLDLNTLLESASVKKYNFNLALPHRVALSLVKGLKIYEKDIDTINNDPLNKQFFYMINCCLNLMFTYKNSDTIVNNLYEILIEEIAAVLMYNGNLALQDKDNFYTTMFQALYSQRVPIIATNKWSCTSFLATSGMGAIMSALYSQFESLYTQGITFTDSVYFEANDLGEKLSIRNNPASNIIFTILEPSSLPKAIDVDVLTEKVQNQISTLKDEEFVTLIIDVSIESGNPKDNKLQELLKKLQENITNGKVNIILVKSLQKYALLGTSKVMAGNVSIINNGNEKFNNTEKLIKQHNESLELEKSKEYQFLSYLLQNAGSFETVMINKAIDNANYLKELLKNVIGDQKQLERSPFIFLPFADIIKEGLVKYCDIPKRDSFAFLQSSFLDIPTKGQECYRLNPGIESKEYLTEKFFALTKISDLNENSSSKEVEEFFKKLTNDKDLRELFTSEPSEDNKYLNNKIYSMLSLLLRLNYNNKEEAGKIKKFVNEKIDVIAKTPMAGLTLEAKHTVNVLHLKNCVLKANNNRNNTTIDDILDAMKPLAREDALSDIINILNSTANYNDKSNQLLSDILSKSIEKRYAISPIFLLEKISIAENLKDDNFCSLLKAAADIIDTFHEFYQSDKLISAISEYFDKIKEQHTCEDNLKDKSPVQLAIDNFNDKLNYLKISHQKEVSLHLFRQLRYQQNDLPQDSPLQNSRKKGINK